MSQPDIIRAWRDEEYYNSLSDEQRAMLPDNPAGVVELTDAQLQNAEGGTDSILTITLPICWSIPFTISCITICGITFAADVPLNSTQQ